MSLVSIGLKSTEENQTLLTLICFMLLVVKALEILPKHSI